MIYLVTFQGQGVESGFADRFCPPRAVVNFTVRQCTVEAENEDEARETVEEYNKCSQDIYNAEYVPREFIQILKVEKI